MLGSAVDLILIALIIMFALNGYRQGFLIGALSFVGFFGGALVGLQLAPLIVQHLDGPMSRIVVSLLAVFGLALLGQSIAAWAGAHLRRSITTDHGRRADDIGGIGVSVIALLLVAWMVAGPLGSSPIPSVARAVTNSAILGAVDSVMPNQARVLYNGLQDAIGNGDFPRVFDDFRPTRAREVPAPDPALANSPAVQVASRSTVKITGSAPGCRRRIEGSGFVYAPERVMTNAHVVAGTRGELTVEVDGANRSGQVVYYDPNLDLAVLHVPGLEADALPWAAEAAETGDDAIVVGYPLDGPFTPTAARIRDISNVQGPDIYESTTVVREVYTLHSRVLSGNSGGPLITPSAEVLGVIFAAALDDPDTGFAVTAAEARPVADASAGRTDPVSTGECT